MFSLVHYVLLLEKLCIAQNGFMKVSGTYFISEFNNFFPVQHFFFFSERIPSRIIFFYICLYLLFRKKDATRCNNINMQLLSNLISDP